MNDTPKSLEDQLSQATAYLQKLSSQPDLLVDSHEEARQNLRQILQTTFQMSVRGKRKGKLAQKRLVIDGFGMDQIWAQIEHHTSKLNAKLINQLTNLLTDEDFMQEIFAQDQAKSTASDEERAEESGEQEIDDLN